MGIWGPGNFDEDAAAEHVTIQTAPLLAQIASSMGSVSTITPDEYDSVALLANLEMLACLSEGLGGARPVALGLPTPSTVAKWRSSYLARWDETIDEMHPKAGFREARRRIIETTFDRVLRASARENGGGADQNGNARDDGPVTSMEGAPKRKRKR